MADLAEFEKTKGEQQGGKGVGQVLGTVRACVVLFLWGAQQQQDQPGREEALACCAGAGQMRAFGAGVLSACVCVADGCTALHSYRVVSHGATSSGCIRHHLTTLCS